MSSPTTCQNYKTGTRRYLMFCRTQQIEASSERTLCQFIAWPHTQHLASSTVKNYLAAVWHSQIALGLGDPKMGLLENNIRGMKRKTQATKRMRLPITPVMLQGMRRIRNLIPKPQRRSYVVCSCYNVVFWVSSGWIPERQI